MSLNATDLQEYESLMIRLKSEDNPLNEIEIGRLNQLSSEITQFTASTLRLISNNNDEMNNEDHELSNHNFEHTSNTGYTDEEQRLINENLMFLNGGAVNGNQSHPLKVKFKEIVALFKRQAYPQFSITKLDESNFEEWDTCLICKLELYQLESMLQSVPIELYNDPNYKICNSIVRANILLNVEPFYLQHIKDEQHSHVIYRMLRERCQGSEQLRFIKSFGEVHQMMSHQQHTTEDTVMHIKGLMKKFNDAKRRNKEELLWIALFINCVPIRNQLLISQLCRMENMSIEKMFEFALAEKVMLREDVNKFNHCNLISKDTNDLYRRKYENGCWECGSLEHRRKYCKQFADKLKKASNGEGKMKHKHKDNRFGNKKVKSNALNAVQIDSSSDHESEEEDKVVDQNKKPNIEQVRKTRIKNAMIVCKLSSKGRSKTYLDSGASDIMLNSDENCYNIDEVDDHLVTASGEDVRVQCVADRKFKSSLGVELEMTNCIVCNELSANFFSVSWFTKKGYKVIFESDLAMVKRDNELMMIAKLNEDGLYEVQMYEPSVNSVVHPKSSDELITYHHERLGHMSISNMRMIQQEIGVKIPSDVKLECITCLKTKITKLPYPRKDIKSTEILDMIHTDLSGRITIPNRERIQYFIMFMDDRSRYSFIYLLQSKEQVFDVFVEFKRMIELQMNKSIKKVKSDNGSEYRNFSFNQMSKETGVVQTFNVPRCSQSNGDIERLNRSIEQLARVLLTDSELGISYFPYALRYANYLKNRTPHRSIDNEIPYELFHNEKVNFEDIKRFGTRVIYVEDYENVGKLKERGKDGIFLGKPISQDGHYILCIEKNRVEVKRHLRFVDQKCNQLTMVDTSVEEQEQLSSTLFDYDDEDQLLVDRLDWCIEDDQQTIMDNEIEADQDSDQVEVNSNDEQIVEPSDDMVLLDENRNSKPQKDTIIELNRKTHKEFIQRFGKESLSKVGPVNTRKRGKFTKYKVNSIVVPKNVKQARNSEHNLQWIEAMKSELTSMDEKNVFVKVQRPKNKQVLPVNWLYKVKYKSDGSIDKFKARLVVLGNLQRTSNQDNTYSPVLNEISFRSLLAFAVKRKMHAQHVDVCTAFLNADIKGEVFVELPPGFEEDGCVWLLKKSLYGLKSSARDWYLKLKQTLIKLGFKMSKSDQCVFYKFDNDKLIIVGIYVDDLLLLADSEELLQRTKEEINDEFTISDKGTVSQFLNLEINYDQSAGVMLINQREYIRQTLEHYGMSECCYKKTTVPVDAELYEENGELLEEPEIYMSMVGRLIYLSTHSRPDITFVVNRLCSFMNKPTTHTLDLAKHVLKYLRYTINYNLVYRSSGDRVIEVNTDSDYANDQLTSRSISGVFVQMFGNLVAWSSIKQMKVSQSTCEAEINSINESINCVIYIREFLADFIERKEVNGIIYNDNTSAISTCRNGGEFSKNKHYRIKINHIREVLDDKYLELEHRPSTDMPADLLTKKLSHGQLKKLLNMIGVM